MFHHSSKMQFPVRVEKPDPEFAMLLQQAIGGVEGEIRVAMQYFFQAMGARGDARIRDLLMSTATEELGHIEMLAYAVALNLEGAPLSYQEASAKDPVVNAIMGGMNPRHILSSGLAALPVNANGMPFDMSHIYASGNVAADMLANVTAEATGRVLATRLYNMTEDKGMKDFLSFLIARDTMHQQQWLAVIEDMGGLNASLPIPNSFPQEHEASEHSYYCLNTSLDKPLPKGRWSEGPSYDGKGQFTAKEKPEILGDEPLLGPARPGSGAQNEQISGTVPPTGTVPPSGAVK
ncbi:MAG: manganese catalase family protein [Mixta calida]|uniref:manganese catalase family protein n=1 Tax=Mixta TaxID=2100764 RepID=UPI0016807147|nr:MULTISPECIES: manganese catalase family protein [Mixta]MCR1565869.1 manganese catalase family protein [Mixta sp.]MDU4942410.1 manganese catalase family protein [Mixta calida]MDU5828189.1 manganese catalase family protein [Mixta calida]MDU6414043.1 manganese catalase family protein [Mixta calida]MDU6539106.1 manganese catalase family protein [Mixta calida]